MMLRNSRRSTQIEFDNDLHHYFLRRMIRPSENAVRRTRSVIATLTGRTAGAAIVPSNNGANSRNDVRARAERLLFMRISVVTDRWAAVHFRLRVRYRRVGRALRSTTSLSLQARRQRNYRQILTMKVRHSRLEWTRSEINDHVASGSRAADEQVAVGRAFERIGLIVDRSIHESGLAAMANPGATRPSDGNVAGFGELQQALILGMPMNREVAARKRYERPAPSRADGRVHRSMMRIDDARRTGFARAECFGMDARAGNAPDCEIGAERVHECRWAAEVKIGITRNL